MSAQMARHAVRNSCHRHAKVQLAVIAAAANVVPTNGQLCIQIIALTEAALTDRLQLKC